MNLLKGKTAIITGGSRGIGKGIAEKFAENGANVVFTCIKMSDASKELEKQLEKLGVKAKAYESDAADFNASIKLAEAVLNDFGSIDVLVNNAGITKDNWLMRMSEEDFNDVMKINMNSVFNNTKAVLRQMLKQRNGSIISRIANGNRTIVALSSIHFTVGNSPITVNGANINEARIGVPRK